MFDTLTRSLQRVFRDLRGHGRLTEKNVQDALREVRLALLEADVHYQVAKDFIARVREKCMGEDVLESITPGQQVIKRIHDELAALLGRAREEVDLSRRPTVVMLLGLNGAGKTTTAAKLAARWKREGRTCLLAAGDLRRPAAVDQLRRLAAGAGVAFAGPEPGEDLVAVGRRAVERARSDAFDVVILDTGGRFQIDAVLVAELRALAEAVEPRHRILVLDAATGQESVNVAQAFKEQVGLTGLILTKLDGDARGGAALSVHAVTGCPILYAGHGEKAEDLEPFHPERMASRILGMGDVVSLVEKAQQAFNRDEAAAMEERLLRRGFNLEDFLAQMRQMKKLGPLDKLLDLLPGAAQVPEADRRRVLDGSAGDLKRAEAIILSMTPKERRHPEIIDGRRRARIARGSGTDVRDVNELLKRFQQSKKLMKQLRQRSGRMPLPGLPT
jgi:signal recognition particle subunit SRP54